MFRKIIALFISLSFVLQQAGYAQSMPAPVTADVFRPLHLRYLACEGERLNLIFDRGSNPTVKGMEADGSKLVEYFLTGLSLPNEVFWVNLRPDSSANIIDDRLAQTDMGKVFLEADVQLKKDVAAATSPSTPQGRHYWDRLYKKAGEIYGAGRFDIPTIVRPWIVPGEVVMAESGKGAYIYKATLKVMLEQDYLAGGGRKATGGFSESSSADSRQKELNAYSARLMRELIIPSVTREVNSSRKYAALRQAYYSLIFAQWFKQRAHGDTGSYGRRVDSGDMSGITSSRPWDRMKYYETYRQSFRDGEYSVRQTEGMNVRSYFSGGMKLNDISPTLLPQTADPGRIIAGSPYLEQAQADAAGETEFTGWNAADREQGLPTGLDQTVMRDGGKAKVILISAIVVGAILAGIIFSQFSSRSPMPSSTPTATYALTSPTPTWAASSTPTATATPRAVVLTAETGAAPEAVSVMFDGQIYRFSPRMDGLEAELEFAEFPGGTMSFSYTSACIISEGQYLDLRDADSDYLSLARQMLGRVNALISSGASFSKGQSDALTALQDALDYSVKAAAATQDDDSYTGFRVDLSGGAYYVVTAGGDYMHIQADGDATKRSIVNMSTGVVMVGGRVYHPGDEGYAEAVTGMIAEAERLLKGKFRDDGWRIPEVKDQKAQLNTLITGLKGFLGTGASASGSETSTATAQPSTAPSATAKPSASPTVTVSPTVQVPANADAGSFFAINAGGADYNVYTEYGGAAVWVENKAFAGGKMAFAYDSSAIFSEGLYVDLRVKEYTPLVGKLLDSVNAMIDSGKLNADQKELLLRLQAHLKLFKALNAESQDLSSFGGFRVDLAGPDYYVMESSDEYAWLINDEGEHVKMIFGWKSGVLIVGGRIYNKGDEGYSQAAKNMAARAKLMLQGTFRDDGYKITDPADQKALLEKLITGLETAQKDGGERVDDRVGGVDLSAIPLAFRADTAGFLSRMGAFPVSFSDTARENRNIARLVSGGMVPSAERVQEFFAACYQKGELRRFSGDVLAWAALILREQEGAASETQPVLPQMLAVVQNI